MSYKRFNFPPYYTWSEKQDGTGNVPYLTSGGGFLQMLQYGYAGVRALPGRLRLRPQLPKDVTRMALRRIAYCGERIDVAFNASVATVRLVAPGGETRLRLAIEGASMIGGTALPATFATGQTVFVLCPPVHPCAFHCPSSCLPTPVHVHGALCLPLPVFELPLSPPFSFDLAS